MKQWPDDAPITSVASRERSSAGRVWRLIAIALCAGSELGSQNSVTPGEPARLALGRSVERKIGHGESQDYLIAVKAGEYARVAVDQQSINLVVSCFGPDSKQLFEADTSGIGDSESAEFIAVVDGIYHLRLTPVERNAPDGTYAITLRTIEPANQRHKMRLAAARAVADGMALYRQGTRAAILQAIAKLAEASSNWRAAQDPVEEAASLIAIGAWYIETGDREKALEHATQALTVARASKDQRTVARALDGIGEVHNNFGDKRKAIEYYEEALPLMRSAGDRSAEGHSLSNLAVAISATGERSRAVALFEQAAQIFRELHDRTMQAEVAGNAGVTYDNLGEYQRALESHQYELALKRELGDRGTEAITLNNIGNAYAGLGEFQKALDAYTAALEINRSLGNEWNAAINQNNIAWVYSSLGDFPNALAFHERALAIIRGVKDQRRVATTLNNVAEAYADLGNYRKAIELHNEVLPLRRAVGDVDGEGNSLSNLGKSYAKLGEQDKARDHFDRALAIHRSAGNRYMLATALRNIGSLDRQAGRYDESLKDLDEALEISRAIHDERGEAEALAELARAEYGRGNIERALERADSALLAQESVRLRVTSPRLRASFFASLRDIQELKLEALMRKHVDRPQEGFGGEALQSSERGRARSLLEMLGESGAEIRSGVDRALLDRERELGRLIAGKAELQMRLLGGKDSDAEAAALEKELATFTLELEQIESRIRESSPQYAALTHPAPLSLREIQTGVLDDQTVLLEYALGTHKSFLWTVTTSSIDAFELPPRAEIETAARAVYDLLTARNRNPANESASARVARLRQADSAFLAAGLKASRILLGPAAARIANKRLLVVGEGVLEYLPFGALPEPGSGDSKPVPLIANHEIVTAPSASVVTVLRRETTGRKAAEKALAIFADPVFSADDVRIAEQKAAPPRSARMAPASSSDALAQNFARLHFSRTEAEAIARLAPGATWKALDFDASREAVLKSEIGQYRIVHFATHSVLNNEHPELSGVVLSLVDRAGQPQNGFLRLYDIYNLRLGADLVVLSACQTALGGEIKSEGLIGLTRGFLYAGAPRVVATLWEVDDRTTAEMMKRFYESMLVRGERPAAALRSAQIAMWKTRGWDVPYYWSAFTLQGEWR